MNEYTFMLAGYVAIVILTLVLVVLNAHGVVSHFLNDHNPVRLISYLLTLVIVGSGIIMISFSVVDHVIESQTFLQTDSDRVGRVNHVASAKSSLLPTA